MLLFPVIMDGCMADPDLDTVEWSFDEQSGIGRLVLDRPDSLNALSTQLRADVVAGFEAFQNLDNEADTIVVRAVIVDGAGDRAFSAGADVTEFEDRTPSLFDDDAKVYRVCRRFPAPVIAEIDGYCLGGGLVLAVTCDFRLASERSEFGLPEVDYDLVPGEGFMRQLAGLVGVSRAKELHMTAEHISAVQAEADGIVDHVYPADELDDRVEDLAATIAEKSPAPIRTIKDIGNLAAGLNPEMLYEYRTRQWLGGAERYSH